MTDEEIIELMAQKILCCGFHSGLNFAEEISYKTAYALAYGLLDLRDSKDERLLFTKEDLRKLKAKLDEPCVYSSLLSTLCATCREALWKVAKK